MIRYFAVETKCGHVGKNKCIYIWFAIKAENGKAAVAKAREYKRVKHHHKDAIRVVREISFEKFIKICHDNADDPYLKCKNIQQQHESDNLESRIEYDEYLLSKMKRPTQNRNTAYFIEEKCNSDKGCSLSDAGSLLRRYCGLRIIMIYYIGDTHFGDKRIMELARRPYISTQEMDKDMMHKWNQRVKENDTIYILEDFAFNDVSAQIIEKLQGKKSTITWQS